MYTYIDMSSKTISILNEAYESLKNEKSKKESFSKVILRLTKKRPKISESFGKWTVSEEELKEVSLKLKKAWAGFGKK